ncbi:MAG: ABC transporter permease [Bacillati bacterium ANGP1]|uniref:Transport permease protein n=1 Tax=Candidatus Segetimicrobium genomatis TaxID=2569760 RepID=A0A537KZX2_9BACT|nr:MAG: ABC transporter permease [Terrabacteria group bacterium ANGP1]
MNLQRLFSIIRKETAQLLRDRRTLGTIITLPIIQMVLYGYLSNEVLHQPTAVWDQSASTESRALVSTFEKTRYFSVRYWASNLGEIERRLDAGQVKVGLVIPPDYAKRLRGGEPVQVMIMVDASDATSARVILSVAGGVGASISRDVGIVQLARAGLRPPPQPVEVRTRAWYNPNLQSQLFIVPGVLGLVLQFTTTFLTIGAIVRERELGTLEQLVVTPIRPSELMLGKILPLIGLGYINLTFILLLAWAWFGVTVKGSILLLYVMTLAFFFSSLGIGTLLSTVSRTFQQAAQLAQLVLLPSILISGFLFPRESLPKVLYWIGYAVPLTYFVTIIRGILVKGVGFRYLYPQIIPLVFLGAVVFTLAIVRFQKKID